MGSLDVSVNGQVAWSKSGNQGNAWKIGAVDLSKYDGKQAEISFVGTRGTSWQGDAAIDNVKFVSPNYVPPTPAPTPPIIPVQIGSSIRSNKKCVNVNNGGVVCAKDAGNRGKRLNKDYANAGDTFDITGEPGKICAKRTDSSRGWGMNLKIGCARGSPVPVPAPVPTPRPKLTTPKPTPKPLPNPTPSPTAPLPSPTPPVVVVGPPGPPGQPGPPGPVIVNQGPPGPPGPPR